MSGRCADGLPGTSAGPVAGERRGLAPLNRSTDAACLSQGSKTVTESQQGSLRPGRPENTRYLLVALVASFTISCPVRRFGPCDSARDKTWDRGQTDSGGDTGDTRVDGRWIVGSGGWRGILSCLVLVSIFHCRASTRSSSFPGPEVPDPGVNWRPSAFLRENGFWTF